MKAVNMLEQTNRELSEAKQEKESLRVAANRTKELIDRHETMVRLIKQQLCGNCDGYGENIDPLYDSTIFCKECNGSGFKEGALENKQD